MALRDGVVTFHFGKEKQFQLQAQIAFNDPPGTGWPDWKILFFTGPQRQEIPLKEVSFSYQDTDSIVMCDPQNGNTKLILGETYIQEDLEEYVEFLTECWRDL